MFVNFLPGRVPCVKCARVRRRSGQSAWVDIQAGQLEKGNFTFPLSISRMVTLNTVAFCV